MRSATAKAGCLFLLWSAGAAAAPAGRLEICPRHPYYFRDGDRHVVLLGVSDRDLLNLWENRKGFSWRTYLEDLATHHLNYVRQDVCSWGALRAPSDYPAQFSAPASPFARTGPGRAVDGRPKFDLTTFDPSYFQTRLKPFLREAARRGIYVELTLFEGFRRSRDFAECLYADANNVNRLGLHPRVATSDAALDHPRLMAVQHAYVDKILAETAPFGHVIYEISNETGGKRWVAHWIDYIHHHPTHPSRLVSAGEQTSSFDPRTGANDVVVKHRGGGGLYATDAGVASHHAALLRFRVGKPVSHNEYFLFANRSTSDLNFPRKMMWADFTAGGHSNFYDFTFWRGTGRTLDDGQPSRRPPAEILRGGQYLLDFLTGNRVEFWQMAPHDELATVEAVRRVGRQSHQSSLRSPGTVAQSPGTVGLTSHPTPSIFCLARPGEQYVCYVLGDGPVIVTLQGITGPFSARWYDPKSGRLLAGPPQESAATGGLFRSPPFEQDIVLYVRKKAS